MALVLNDNSSVLIYHVKAKHLVSPSEFIEINTENKQLTIGKGKGHWTVFLLYVYVDSIWPTVADWNRGMIFFIFSVFLTTLMLYYMESSVVCVLPGCLIFVKIGFWASWGDLAWFAKRISRKHVYNRTAGLFYPLSSRSCAAWGKCGSTWLGYCPRRALYCPSKQKMRAVFNAPVLLDLSVTEEKCSGFFCNSACMDGCWYRSCTLAHRLAVLSSECGNNWFIIARVSRVVDLYSYSECAAVSMRAAVPATAQNHWRLFHPVDPSV